jgi:hypothetical protein
MTSMEHTRGGGGKLMFGLVYVVHNEHDYLKRFDHPLQNIF